MVSGFGLGFAYIVPIAMLQKWFPDKKGLITGLAVGGFGFGAVLTSPLAQWLIDRSPDDPTNAFLPLGIAYLVMSLIGASFFRNPPQGYVVPGFEPVSAAGGGRRSARTTPRARPCTRASGTSSPRSSPSASAPASRSSPRRRRAQRTSPDTA